MSPSPRRPHRQVGFTLLELVIVLVILATLAGLVISQISMLGRSADMAATAKTQQDVANNLQLFFVLQKRYPQNMDSLLESTGAGTFQVYGPGPAGITNESQQTTGLPISGPSLHADLTAVDLATLEAAETPTGQYRRSLSRLGFDTVLDHSRTVLNSNDSAVTARTLLNAAGSGAATNVFVARIASGSVAARKIYPGTNGIPPAGTVLVALGVGPRASCVPTTMLAAPIYPGCDGRYYGRFIAVFALSTTGERGTLVGVCDSYGRFTDYSIQEFNQSLPNNSRQG